jgi:hypothetical protein
VLKIKLARSKKNLNFARKILGEVFDVGARVRHRKPNGGG